jgi:glycosyltransferase involved in cell wall biosynthesis
LIGERPEIKKNGSKMKIVYLLHRFPVLTDTFIRREIRGIQTTGTEVEVISVWTPNGKETTSDLLQDWSRDVRFLFPQSILSILLAVLKVMFSSPKRFVAALRLGFATSRPGLRGMIYQIFYIGEAILAANAINKSNVDHIHNHFGDHSGIVTMLASKLTNINYSISFHGPHVFFDGANAAIKEKVKHASFIRCISHFCCSQLIVLCGGTDMPALKIVHCGLDLSRYQFHAPREEIRNLFCAARLVPEKGIEFLIQALGLLINNGYLVNLRIAGDGPRRASLEDSARRLNVADRVCFLGNLSEQEVAHELSMSDLFILPSLAEGIPVSIMEAMAVGLPVIATNIAGTSELVDDRKTGLLVRPADSEAIAKAVVTVIERPEFRRKAADSARAKVGDEFDIAKECAKLNECFQRFPCQADKAEGRSTLSADGRFSNII